MTLALTAQKGDRVCCELQDPGNERDQDEMTDSFQPPIKRSIQSGVTSVTTYSSHPSKLSQLPTSQASSFFLSSELFPPRLILTCTLPTYYTSIGFLPTAGCDKPTHKTLTRPQTTITSSKSRLTSRLGTPRHSSQFHYARFSSTCSEWNTARLGATIISSLSIPVDDPSTAPRSNIRSRVAVPRAQWWC